MRNQINMHEHNLPQSSECQRTSCTNKCSYLQYNVIYAECMTGTSMACGVMVFVDGHENQYQVNTKYIWNLEQVRMERQEVHLPGKKDGPRS